jgi:hypothetical protein
MLARDVAAADAAATRDAALEMARMDGADEAGGGGGDGGSAGGNGSSARAKVAFVSPFFLALKNRPEWLSRLLREKEGGVSFPGACVRAHASGRACVHCSVRVCMAACVRLCVRACAGV